MTISVPDRADPTEGREVVPWTAKQKRDARLSRSREGYIRECAFTGEARRTLIKNLTSALIMSKLRVDLLGTLTFPPLWSDEARRTAVLSFCRKWFRHGRYCVGWERHQSGKLHAHVIAEDVVDDRGQGLRRLSFVDAWHVETRGMARLEAVRSQEDAANYVSKYITKGDQGELEFGEGVGSDGGNG